ncbi:MAG TPA: 3-oxoacyl-[acyl-carrier-protein] synthase III C-terminal domain-containing protein [Opitutaceae bacterium]
MNEIYVSHLSFALGDETHPVEDTVDGGKTLSTAEVLREAGFRQHHVCRDGTTAYDLAKSAVAQLEGRLDDIGAIVYATCIPINGNIGSEDRYRETRDVKHLMDFPASRLQSDFGLDRAIVVGLNQQACTGMLGSLQLARMMLLSEPTTKRVLCVTADRFPKGALFEQSYNLISDGAAACIVSREPGAYRLVAWHGITNGAMALVSDDETIGSYFNYTHRIIQETLAKSGLTIRDIGWIVPQNMNNKGWQILARLLPFDYERVYFRSMPEVAHVISGDNVVNLHYLETEGKIRAGERLLLTMAGYGLNWQCVILEKR